MKPITEQEADNLIKRVLNVKNSLCASDTSLLVDELKQSLYIIRADDPPVVKSVLVCDSNGDISSSKGFAVPPDSKW